MKIIAPYVELMHPVDGESMLRHIERCGRTCYKSEGKITASSYKDFVAQIIKREHESVLEHANVSLKFVCDRGVSHELVRHRLASYCQESTRYCNYRKGAFGSEIVCIKPIFLVPKTDGYRIWRESCENAENAYFKLLDYGCTPQEARSVLPNSLKTEVVMTANLREWRHFFQLRCSSAAHPQMREVATQALALLHNTIPVVFDDIATEVLK